MIRRVEYPDGSVEGLMLRVTFRGVKSWALRYRLGKRKPRILLGRYSRIGLERARRRARIALDLHQCREAEQAATSPFRIMGSLAAVHVAASCGVIDQNSPMGSALE